MAKIKKAEVSFINYMAGGRFVIPSPDQRPKPILMKKTISINEVEDKKDGEGKRVSFEKEKGNGNGNKGGSGKKKEGKGGNGGNTGGGRKFTAEQDQTMISMRMAGVEMKDICAAVKAGPKDIKARLDELGVPFESDGQDTGGVNGKGKGDKKNNGGDGDGNEGKFTKEIDRKIMAMNEKNIPHKQIAQAVGISKKEINARLQELKNNGNGNGSGKSEGGGNAEFLNSIGGMFDEPAAQSSAFNEEWLTDTAKAWKNSGAGGKKKNKGKPKEDSDDRPWMSGARNDNNEFFSNNNEALWTDQNNMPGAWNDTSQNQHQNHYSWQQQHSNAWTQDQNGNFQRPHINAISPQHQYNHAYNSNHQPHISNSNNNHNHSHPAWGPPPDSTTPWSSSQQYQQAPYNPSNVHQQPAPTPQEPNNLEYCPHCPPSHRPEPPYQGRLRPNSAWPREDCEILEEMEEQYVSGKWMHMQVLFFNRTGRMIDAGVIERKFRDDGYRW